MKSILSIILLSTLNISFAFINRGDQTPLIIPHDFKNPITDEKSQKSVFEFSLKSAKGLFYWPCLVGTPPKEFNLLVDTGSSDLWLILAECNNQACLGRNKYSPDDSITYKAFGEQNVNFDISYVSTNVSGHFFFENIIMDYFVLKGQILGGVIKEEGQDMLKNLPMDGIMGMGYPDLATTSTLKFKPFLQNLFKEKILPLNIFTLHFGKTDGSGGLTFGGINKNYLGSEIKYYDVQQTGYWQIGLDYIIIGNTVINVCEKLKEFSGHCGAIIDSGTTFIGVPAMFSDSVYALIGGGAHCDIDRLPSITFVIKGDKYVFEPKDYATVNHKELAQGPGEEKCTLGILPIDIKPPKGPLFILGTLFLKKYYTIFDVENNRIGFSLLKTDDRTQYKFDDYITSWGEQLHQNQPVMEKSTFLPKKSYEDEWQPIFA